VWWWFVGAALAGDLDGDRIPDGEDGCPTVAEDADGVLDRDGCPDQDDDGDGVPDAADRCPRGEYAVEGTDQVGCAGADADHDGIPDLSDACSSAAEDGDGHEDGDGCPEADPDGDHDGIADFVDRCPGRREDPDGRDDADGCPEVAGKQTGFDRWLVTVGVASLGVALVAQGERSADVRGPWTAVAVAGAAVGVTAVTWGISGRF
jgi:hypothetical protein